MGEGMMCDGTYTGHTYMAYATLGPLDATPATTKCQIAVTIVEREAKFGVISDTAVCAKR